MNEAIAPRLAGRVRLCTYYRVNVGQSDDESVRHSGADSVRDLRALLTAAAEHAVAARAEDTRWDRIAAHYAELERLTGSPVVRLNRAVAVAEAEGPGAGLQLLEGLEGSLPRSHRLAAVRGALLADLGELGQARHAYQQALALCGNEVEAEHLRTRLSQLAEA